jgi:hypothetical protein
MSSPKPNLGLGLALARFLACGPRASSISGCTNYRLASVGVYTEEWRREYSKRREELMLLTATYLVVVER